MSIRRTATQVADLEESLAALTVLEENLKKTDAVTQKMSTLLATVFDARLGKLEESIKPMYNTTRNLTQISQNIDATIAAVDNMKKNFDTLPREEAIIKAGPKQNIQEYLGSILRLQATLNTLSRSQIGTRDKMQSQIVALLKYGVKQLDDVFKRTLTTHSQLIDPTSLLTQDLPFPKIPPQPLQLLSTLGTFLGSMSGLESTYEQIYADVRGSFLSNSLSETAAAVLSSAQGRPNQASVSPATLIRSLIALLESEMDVLQSIIRKRQTEVFMSTSIPPMGQFSRTFKALNTQIRGNPSSNFRLTLTILEDLALAQELIDKSSLSRESVEGIKKDIAALEREARGIGAVGVGDVIEDVKRRGNNVLMLPADANVIDLTVDTMTKLSGLMVYSKPLTQLLMSLPSGSWNRSNSLPTSTLPPLNLDVDSRVVLAHWTMDVVDTLVITLDNKSKSLLRPKSNLTHSLFILNNLSEIEKRVRQDRMLANVIGSIGAAEKERDMQSKRSSNRSSSGSGSGSVGQGFSMPKSFEKVKRAGLDGYLDGYKDVVSHLLDVTYIKGGSNRSSGSLSGKEREALKERFRSFNEGFEEIIRINRGLSIPDPDVRGLVVGEIKRVVIPLYSRFYDKHAHSEFTKHTSKYIKWDKTQLDGIISRFFEGTPGLRSPV